MNLLASLDSRDRRLLAVTALLVLCTLVLLALVHPEAQEDSPVPSTYSATPHGAKAAFLLLGQLGYRVERSEEPLDTIADAADGNTVLILAQPSRPPTSQETASVARILARGGRVLAAGLLAAAALPQENLDSQPPQLVGGICQADPSGFSPLAAGGKVVMRDLAAVWKLDKPAQRASFVCGGGGVVVSYAVGKGSVVWWASPSPLENRDIAASGSLDLLLNSLELRRGDRIVWDESLHAQPPSAWNPLRDRVILALLSQLLLLFILLILARGRRSGPLRPLPQTQRASPLEFIRSLGDLYRASRANDVPVIVAYERFRARLAQRHGIAGAQSADAATLAATLRERFGVTAPGLEQDLAACDGAGRLANLKPRQALALVKTLAGYLRTVEQQAQLSTALTTNIPIDRGQLGSQHGPQHVSADPRTRPGQRRIA